jgi:hypothetical protein
VIIIRIWHYALLPYLPELQFKGQLRELVAIMHDWRDKGTTNHLLINKVCFYPKSELSTYFQHYRILHYERYNKSISQKTNEEFIDFAISRPLLSTPIYDGWHTKEYLRSNMANLYEKQVFGVGKSRITDEEWQRLVDGYRQITNEDWVL